MKLIQLISPQGGNRLYYVNEHLVNTFKYLHVAELVFGKACESNAMCMFLEGTGGPNLRLHELSLSMKVHVILHRTECF